MLGCFKDSATRDLPNVIDMFSTPAKCFEGALKAGYKYAALQYGRECYAGNTYGSLGQALETECYMRCGPNNSFYCGGDYRNSVYQLKADEP